MADTKKKQYHQGHDIKSLAINLATIILFFLPFPLYFGEGDQAKQYTIAMAASFLLALVLPPFGWKRPHPYTDMPGNEPLQFRKNN